MTMRALLTASIMTTAIVTMQNQAEAQQDYYRGKTVNVYIGFAAGGSYDYYGRLVARHIGKHLPGNPTVVPNSMPGAGSLRAANYLYTVAPKDGTAMGIVTQTLPLEPALGNPGAKYNANEFGKHRPGLNDIRISETAECARRNQVYPRTGISRIDAGHAGDGTG